MLIFLRCVAEAVVGRGIRGLMGAVPFGQQLYDVSADAIERYRERHREKQIAEDLEAVIQAGIEEVRQESARITKEVAGEQPVEVQLQLESYLTQIPSIASQSLRRPQDPTGTTVPATLQLDDPRQLCGVLPQHPPRFKIDDVVPDAPQWKLIRLLGAGGFGEVWLARHTFLHEERAFKFCLDSNAREQLLRHEGQTVRRVMQASKGIQPTEHGIVPLLDVYLEGETPWLAYEYISGGSLAGLIREWSTLSPEVRARQALEVLEAIAEVIGRLHVLPQAIIHRDLKPANILYRKNNEKYVFRVTDFGISQIIATETIHTSNSMPSMQLSLGEAFRGSYTPIYASRQQKLGHDPDIRDDVHALGVLGYQMIVGDLTAERPAGKWRRRLKKATGLREEIFDLLEDCWDDEPEERPANGQVIAERLRTLLANDEQISASTNNQDDADIARQDYQQYLKVLNRFSSTKSFLQENCEHAPHWFQAANQEVVEAMVLWGDCLQEGIGVEQNGSQAVKWYRKAAERGNGSAMNNLGTMYHTGRGIDQSYTQAAEWYHRAAAVGNAMAMNSLGIMYQDGLGVMQDDTQASEWYHKAAAAGNASAMTNIGMMFGLGQAMEQDDVQAMNWYRKGAEAGDGTAMNNLGWMYKNGRGVEQDDLKAVEWYCKGAEAGNAMAMNNLGWMYQHGRGVKQNDIQAAKWYQKAYDNGCAEALEYLQKLQGS